jgi:hypothetical protein
VRKWWSGCRLRAKLSIIEGVVWVLSVPPTFLFMDQATLIKWIMFVSLWTAARTAFAGAQADLD